MKQLLVLALVAALPAAFAGGAGAGNPWEPLRAHGPQRITIHILPAVGGRDSVLDPNVAIVPDVPVVLRVVNTSAEFHSFTIPGLHVNAVVMPGTAAHPRVTTVHFVARAAGTYRWHCAFCPAVHHQGGMSGTIYALVAG